jgi:hypothetical protein
MLVPRARRFRGVISSCIRTWSSTPGPCVVVTFAALALVFVLVAVARAAGHAGAVALSRFILGAGVTACLVSVAEGVLGVLLATSLASPAHVSRAGEVFDAINRLDGVKMLVLATVIATAELARRELGLPRWLSAAGVITSLALVASGVGYLALDGALASAAFVSLPLLLIWVSGTGVALGRREAKDEAAGSTQSPAAITTTRTRARLRDVNPV